VEAQEVNRNQKECEYCDDVEKPCSKHKSLLKVIKSKVRKKIREIYDSRSECEPCQLLAENFADKMIEYLWRRKIKKEKLNPFMEVVRALSMN
jgi:hypothetical protein